MFPSKALVSLVLIALSVVDASPLTRRSGTAKLSLTRSINQLQEGTTIADLDRARAQAMINAAQPSKRQASVPITNGFVNYAAAVGVGEPATTYNLLIDTGSSNTWLGAKTPYAQTSSSSKTQDTVSVSYGSGSFSGDEYTDTVTLAPGLVIQAQSIGVASKSSGITDVDGILGVGPVDLTVGTLSPDTSAPIPTVVDNLFTQGTIMAHELGVYFTPALKDGQENPQSGELTFGGVDSSQFVGELTYVPITTTSPASQYWGIDQSIYYGFDSLQSTTAGIVDTGTTLILLATDVFQQYQSLTGGVPDHATGLLKITNEQYYALQSLFFNVGGTEFMLMPNAQIWPRSLNSQIGGAADGIYLIVADIGTKSGAGLDFINGLTFLERFYSVYDTANAQVGLANTWYTFEEVN